MKGQHLCGVLPFHLSPSWDNLSRSENRSAVLEVSARHKTSVGVRRSCGSAAARRDRQPACPIRIVAVRWQALTCGAGVDRSFSRVREVSAHPPPGSSLKLGAAAIQLCRGSAPLIYQGHKTQKFGLAYRQFFKYFFMFSNGGILLYAAASGLIYTSKPTAASRIGRNTTDA